MRLGKIRLLTVIVVVLGSGWAVTQGVNVLWFQIVSQRASASEDQRQTLLDWSDKAGLASLALAQAMRAPLDPTDPKQLQERRDLLVKLLAVRPVESEPWMALATVRQAMGAPAAEVDSAYRMSVLTGPNEGGAMVQRALFGILNWDDISAEKRTRTMIDLCGLDIADLTGFQIVMAVKAEQSRDDIGAAMIANGCTARTTSHFGF